MAGLQARARLMRRASEAHVSNDRSTPFIFDDWLDYEAGTVDPRVAQAGFDAESEADRAFRAKLRKVERIHSRVVLGASGLLLVMMAVRIIAAAFGGRL